MLSVVATPGGAGAASELADGVGDGDGSTCGGRGCSESESAAGSMLSMVSVYRNVGAPPKALKTTTNDEDEVVFPATQEHRPDIRHAHTTSTTPTMASSTDAHRTSGVPVAVLYSFPGSCYAAAAELALIEKVRRVYKMVIWCCQC